MKTKKKIRLGKAGLRVGAVGELLKLSPDLEDYCDLQAVKRAQKSGFYQPYDRVRIKTRP